MFAGVERAVDGVTRARHGRTPHRLHVQRSGRAQPRAERFGHSSLLLSQEIFNASIGDEPHECDDRITSAGDQRLPERQWNRNRVDHDGHFALFDCADGYRQSRATSMKNDECPREHKICSSGEV